MHNLWLVAKHEFRRTVVRRGFLFATLLVPVMIVAPIALVILVESMSENRSPLGYVDYSGSLDVTRQAMLPDADERIEIRAFPDEATARAALENEQIQVYFVLPASYPQVLKVDLYYLQKPPSNDAWRAFDDFVRANLVARLPSDVQQRVFEGTDVTVHDIVSNRDFGDFGIVNALLPLAATLFFFFTTMSASGYMIGVVANEKENRTMEILLTSMTPGQLIGGKLIGLLAATLTQLAVYVAAIVVGVTLATPHVPELQHMTVPWSYLGVMALFFIPSYALLAALMVAIGGAVTDLQQGQQIAGMLNLVFAIPLLLALVIFENPGSPAVTAMTLFPTSAFMSIALRWQVGTVPAWQLVASWTILAATVILMVWVAARIFRAGMLRYGNPLSLKSALAVLRQGYGAW